MPIKTEIRIDVALTTVSSSMICSVDAKPCGLVHSDGPPMPFGNSPAAGDSICANAGAAKSKATTMGAIGFANALAHEIKSRTLSLTIFAPGGIVTEMTATEQFNDLQGWLMPVKQAAKEGIYALKSRKFNYVPGALNRLGNIFMNLLPKKLIVGILARTYQRSLEKVSPAGKAKS